MYDYAIIGGGIVGLSTAREMQRRKPGKRIVVIDKERAVAAHQTGHNSGVIHAGIYYEPGSLKAAFCKRGLVDTIDFCRTHGIPVEQCGKLIVATNDLERELMNALYERALINELDVELLDAEQLKEREPNITGIGAIYLKTTGITSFAQISEKLAELFEADGGEIRLNTEVVAVREQIESVVIETSAGILQARFLVACGGLQADRIARMMGIETDFRVVPYRGEYYELPASKADIVKHLIYPVPNPELPFLGVHLTRMIDGKITVGPNAVQAWKREGYGRVNVSLRDCADMLRFPGFWRVAARFFRNGLAETWNSFWKPGYLKLVQKYCPSIELRDLHPYPPGVRAQAVLRDGTLLHDFLFLGTRRSLHVCNAPSPAATSAFPIAAHICDKIEEAQTDD
jgi:L-2-hydroxyglutarate oxidase